MTLPTLNCFVVTEYGLERAGHNGIVSVNLDAEGDHRRSFH